MTRISTLLTILIIRHAEKPAERDGDPDLGPGLTAKGKEHEHSLVLRGWQRAGAWTALFGSNLGGADYPRPDTVFAANPNQRPGGGLGASTRPWETVTPLCERLHTAPVTTYGVGEEGPMLASIMQLTGVALICWEHKHITSAILPTLARGQTLLNLPPRWDRMRFDVVLRFDRARSGASWTFRQLLPRLLDGDSEVPLGRGED